MTVASLSLISTESAGWVAPVVIIVMLLVAIGYSLAKYKDYAKMCRICALTSLETGLKPSCPG